MSLDYEALELVCDNCGQLIQQFEEAPDGPGYRSIEGTGTCRPFFGVVVHGHPGASKAADYCGEDCVRAAKLDALIIKEEVT